MNVQQTISSATPAVLIVDDDADIRETLRYLLEESGYAVADAPDGEGALAALRASPRGMVVLLDYIMPTLDGAEVLEALADGDGGAAAIARHAYVLITASPQKAPLALMQRLAQLDAPTLAKPFSLDDLLDAVAQAAARLAQANSTGGPSC